MKILIIIPAYNEEKNILKTVDAIRRYGKNSHEKLDFIVINDKSTDGTETLLDKNKIPHITLIKNLGIGGAVQTGYKYALDNNYDFAIQFDGDNQHDANSINIILAPLKEGKADLVIGSRFVGKKNENNFRSSLARRIGIKIISAMIRFRTGKTILDTTSGFRGANKKVIFKFANDYPTEYPEPISTTDVILNGGKVEEVPVLMRAREAGSSSIKSYKNIYYMINVILLILTLRRKK
ncbi:glycosyltransferase family 2 protein [Candidatus Saccharibacteria bacterium]|nr:glycosyltransferase family 2 protein [Candidatus Saccharibacteria bacterium]